MGNNIEKDTNIEKEQTMDQGPVVVQAPVFNGDQVNEQTNDKELTNDKSDKKKKAKKKTKFELNKIRNKVLVKYPYFGTITANVIFYEDNTIDTACTDGLDIYYSTEFMETLTVEQQVFVIAHEISHIAFNHIKRSKDKEQELYNIATDAVINAFLMEDGLPNIEGGIDIPWAKNYNADELYEILKNNRDLAKKLIDKLMEQNPNFGKNNGAGHASHGKWDPNAKTKKGSSGSSGNNDQKQKGKGQQSDGEDEDENEKKNGKGQNGDDKDKKGEGKDGDQDKKGKKGSGEDEESEEERRRKKRIANEQKEFEEEGEKKAFNKNKKEKRDQLEKMKEEVQKETSHQAGSQAGEYQRRVGDIGKSSRIVDWRYYLRESIKYDLDWSYKNASIEDGVLRANLEEFTKAEVEIVLDTSGSIDAELLKNFLRECKNIMRTSKVKVGCFDTKFYGFHDIRNEYDIEHMKFEGGGGTDFDVAVGAFTNKVVNRIVFTDGYAPMPKKPVRAIWVVIGDTEIHPEGGKVIYLNRHEFDKKYANRLIKK